MNGFFPQGRYGLLVLLCSGFILAGLTNSCDNPLANQPDPENYSLYLSDNQYVNIPNSPSLALVDSGEFSVELFVSADSIIPPDNPALFMVSNDSGGDEIGIYRSKMSDDRLLIYIHDQPISGINNTPVNGLNFDSENWYYIAVTYDSGTVKLYLNGNLKLSGGIWDSTAIRIGSSPVLIGADLADASLGNYWNGSFDEVRFWGRTLSAAEILYNANHPKRYMEHYNRKVQPRITLLGLWRFNDGHGTGVHDASAYGNNGEVTGGGKVVWRKKGYGG